MVRGGERKNKKNTVLSLENSNPTSGTYYVLFTVLFSQNPKTYFRYYIILFKIALNSLFIDQGVYKSLYKPFYIAFTIGPTGDGKQNPPPRVFGRRSFRFHLPGISRCPHGQFLIRNPIFRSKIKEFGV